MNSMSLEFILNESEEAPESRPSKQQKRKTASASRSDPATADTSEQSAKRPARDNKAAKEPSTPDRYVEVNRGFLNDSFIDDMPAPRQQHVRQLQNLRQRRYRERKKSSASAQQENAERLKQENAALETAILEQFKSRM
ncbi:hypothetical protein PHYSODRAFT_334597 [Phytophthora sojae]|uniref:Uncharacterized protein n=1 Tax=Phytophthora sojae (strain P6497) TaxID=1094619 RepID=G4ZQ06_PHYSP|nr:hypothetical protein PHYSODRAFT_334597 [Phytophthora sojae]EGZ16410.1 hypothetical protein PHYSODRAFT_334597 [Phytophthora sojae]|eukprot:XP_009530159.1 hypothetical protein PHYSODRAFT_334597 [Phytophthora sojae]